MPELLADHRHRPCVVMHVLQRNYIHSTVVATACNKMWSGRICGADLNGDNLWIYRVYLWISDYCRVTVRVGVMVRVRVRNMVRLGLVLGLALGLLFAEASTPYKRWSKCIHGKSRGSIFAET